MVTLKNSDLAVKINELGAEVKSIYGFDTEYIWEGKKEIWGNSCPLLFPICGGLKEDKYTVYGERILPAETRLCKKHYVSGRKRNRYHGGIFAHLER